MASAQVKPKSPYVYNFSSNSMHPEDERKGSFVKIAEGSRKEDVYKSKVGNKKTCNVPDTNLLLACLVTLCFHPLFGAIAAYLSISAASAYRDGRQKEGERRAFISVIISLIGIVFTVVLVMTLVLWLTIGEYKLPVKS